MDFQKLFAAYEPLLLLIAAQEVGRLHESIDNTDKLQPWEKSALDAITNLVSTKVLAHVATVSATPVGAPATPTVAAPGE